MRADAMDGIKSRLITGWSPSRTHPPSAKFLRLSQLRKLRGCDQVAAVCYRVRPGGIEFLLVRTNSGHWTFPKGKAEPGLTHAQAAALEAFEEAGVHGRIEEASFARYFRRKRGDSRDSTRSAPKPAEEELAVQAHLCEVSRLEPPQESNRHPTWFSVEKTKRRLQEDRSSDFAAELARVVDRAVNRIKRIRSEKAPAK
jgi:8-oxo-dGTP pyrophosphatase MutT (NUDIX family)